jgi:hypothetical protein
MLRMSPSPAKVPASAASVVFQVEFPVDVVDAGCVAVALLFVEVLVVLFILSTDAIHAPAPAVVVSTKFLPGRCTSCTPPLFCRYVCLNPPPPLPASLDPPPRPRPPLPPPG